MNFSCNKCQRRYSIADEKVRGKTVKVRCKNCQNVISVEGPPVETEESTRVVSLADVERLREQDRSLAEEDAAIGTASLGAQSWEDEPTRTAPVREGRPAWFVMIKSKQEGPIEELALRELLVAGTISARSYFWKQDMAEWKRGQDLPELAELLAPAEAASEAPPPPPARMPPPPVMSPEPEPELPPEPEPEPESAAATPWEAEPTLPSPQARHGGAAPRPLSVASPTPWEPEGEEESTSRGRAAADAAAPLGELFSDLDLPAEQQSAEGDGGEEPLASLGKESRRQRAYVEETQHITKKPPVRRGPGLKIALGLVLLLVLLVGVPFVLTEMQVIPLRVWRTDAAGNPVEQPVSLFSAEGLDAFKDTVLGRPRPAPPPRPTPKPAPVEAPKTEPAPAAPEATAPPAGAPETGSATAPATAAPQGATPPGETPKPGAAEAAAAGTAPQVAAAATPDAEPKKEVGPSPEGIARVLEKSQTTFKSCIDQVLRKNPKLVDTTLLLTTTVDSKGAVKKIVFDRQGIEGSASGECFKKSARRLVFPAISRESMEVQIPVVLSKAQYSPPDDAP